MNYTKHYNLLIERARTRQLSGYTEKHHIIPKCLGGNNNKTNIVKLTPEEHYLAHQLLVKIYPGNDSLVYAANKMTVSSKTVLRNNKRYGWLKRKFQNVCKKRVGDKNSSFSRSWYYNPDTFESGKFLISEIPNNWIKGRIINRESFEYTTCKCCGTQIKSKNKFCSKECRNIINKKTKEEKSKQRAYDSWNSYINGNYKSPLEFLKHNNYYKSHQHMYRDWNKYVDEYKVEWQSGYATDCKSVS